MQGVLKHRKLGSAEEQKSGVDIILSYLSALPDFWSSDLRGHDAWSWRQSNSGAERL